MAVTSTSTLDNMVATYYEKVMLKILMSTLVLYEHGDKKPLPKHEGKSVVWNAYLEPSAASGEITEGTTPTEFQLSSRSVSATLRLYGRWTKPTDFVSMVAISDVGRDAVKLLARAGRKTIDNDVRSTIFKATLAKNIGSKILSALLSATASSFCLDTGTHANEQFGFPVVFATSATRLSAVKKTAMTVSAQPSLRSFRKAVLQLEVKDAEPFPDGYYHAFINPRVKKGVKDDPKFEAWHRGYPGGVRKMERGWIGDIENMRFYMSNRIPHFNNNSRQVGLIPIVGEGAYGVVDYAGGLHVIAKESGPQDTGNPLNLYQTIGFKVYMTSEVLNPSAGVILLANVEPN